MDHRRIHPVLLGLSTHDAENLISLQQGCKVWMNDDEVVLITPSGEEMVAAEFKLGTFTRIHMDTLQRLVDTCYLPPHIRTKN